MSQLKLKILDFRSKIFTDNDAMQILNEVVTHEWDQIQVRCDNQILCDAVRSKLMRLAMHDGHQFEMTILGSGAAVGVKMHMPAQYIWDESTGRSVPREEWLKEHPGTA